MSSPSVDICVLVYNRPDITLEFFENITKVTPRHLARFWVLDNGSPDVAVARTMKWLKRQCGRFRGKYRGFPAKFFAAAENMHFSGGNNYLSKLGTAPWILFLNNDAFPKEGWLEGLLEAAKANNWGAVGPTSDRVIGIQDIKFNKSTLDLPKRHMTQLLSGFCFLVRRDVFEKIGGWDTIFENGDEDLDLSIRVRAEGWALGVARDVFIHHKCSMSLGPWAAARGKSLSEHFAGTRKILLDKHGERVQNDLWFWDHLTAPRNQWSKMGVLPNGFYFYPPGRAKDQARAISAGGPGILPAEQLHPWTPSGADGADQWSSELHPRTLEGGAREEGFVYHRGVCEGGGSVIQVLRGGERCTIRSDGRERGKRVFCADCEREARDRANHEAASPERITNGVHVREHPGRPLRENGRDGGLDDSSECSRPYCQPSQGQICASGQMAVP